jgi:hypothetical protein
VNVRGDENRATSLERLRTVAGRFPGRVPIMLRITTADGRAVMIETQQNTAIDPTPDFLTELEPAVGRNGVRFLARREVCLKPRPERRWSPRPER